MKHAHCEARNYGIGSLKAEHDSFFKNPKKRCRRMTRSAHTVGASRMKPRSQTPQHRSVFHVSDTEADHAKETKRKQQSDIVMERGMQAMANMKVVPQRSCARRTVMMDLPVAHAFGFERNSPVHCHQQCSSCTPCQECKAQQQCLILFCGVMTPSLKRSAVELKLGVSPKKKI